MWSQTGFPCYSFSGFFSFSFSSSFFSYGPRALQRDPSNVLLLFIFSRYTCKIHSEGEANTGAEKLCYRHHFFNFRMTVKWPTWLKLPCSKPQSRNIGICDYVMPEITSTGRLAPFYGWRRVRFRRGSNEVGFDAARGDRPECKRDNWLKANNWTS